MHRYYTQDTVRNALVTTVSLKFSLHNDQLKL